MTPVVSAERVRLGYEAAIVVTDSSFEIPSGGVTVVIGPNGSGKSTLLSAIAGLRPPISGNLDVAVAGDRIAYVLQATKVNEVLPVTVREVVAMGRYASVGAYGRMREDDFRAVESALEKMNLLDVADKHMSRLSGGQRQRVFVAQGLAQDHDLLLLDEPLTGLDVTTAQAIDKVIHDETSAGATVVMTSHDLSEARHADHVLLLSGRVVASGTPDAALTQQNLLEAYGSSLLHVERGQVFVDDPAHDPTGSRHVHRERSIHTEADTEGFHSGPS